MPVDVVTILYWIEQQQQDDEDGEEEEDLCLLSDGNLVN